MKKKVSRRIEKKIYINNKIHRKSKNGGTATPERVLGQACWSYNTLVRSLNPIEKEGCIPLDFTRERPRAQANVLFCILPCCCSPPVCLFIMICRECAFLCVQYDSSSCSSKRSMYLLLFSLLLSCIYRSDSP